MVRLKSLLVLAALAVLLAPAVAHAQQSQSTNYQVNEVYFGPGSNFNATSGNYSSNQAAGDTVAGQSSSANYKANDGSTTRREESLGMTANGGVTDVGILSSSTARTATTTFSVISYLSSGYVVTTMSDPPANNSNPARKLANLTTPTASATNTEQFGINLVANTLPTNVGANPQQVPDNTFGFGVAATGYNTPNQYKYVKGDVIAQSNSETGRTNYTITYLYNITPGTPAGLYNFNQVLVATATF